MRGAVWALGVVSAGTPFGVRVFRGVRSGDVASLNRRLLGLSCLRHGWLASAAKEAAVGEGSDNAAVPSSAF